MLSIYSRAHSYHLVSSLFISLRTISSQPVTTRHNLSHLVAAISQYMPLSPSFGLLCLGLLVPWVLDGQTPDIEVITDCNNHINLAIVSKTHSQTEKNDKLTTKLPYTPIAIPNMQKR